jgi:hypothetical protein
MWAALELELVFCGVSEVLQLQVCNLVEALTLKFYSVAAELQLSVLVHSLRFEQLLEQNRLHLAPMRAVTHT